VGGGDRSTDEREKGPADIANTKNKERHINGLGRVYFAAAHDMSARAEANAVPGLGRAWVRHNRRVHFFGNLDVGDRLEITTKPRVQAIGTNAAVVVSSHGKRASDGAVIVVAESVYAP